MSEPVRDPARSQEPAHPTARSTLRPLTRVDAVIALALGVAFTILLLKSVDTLGYARDEGFYFQASSTYGRWFEQLWASPSAALERRAVDAAWIVNHEHPALIKSLFALSNLVLQKKLHLFAMEGTSYRFPAMVLAGGLISLVYVWGAQARSRAAGLVAAVALAAMPRFFFQSHLACFDVPIVAIWTLCAYTFWRSLCTHPGRPTERPSGLALQPTGASHPRLNASDPPPGDLGIQPRPRSGRRLQWPILTALCFGLALDTKHNSWFLPIVFVAHTAITLVASRFLISDRDRAAARNQLNRALLTLIVMAVIGPLVFVALWPWIWHDTYPRLVEYARFHLNHDYYNMEFLGKNYWTPPMPRAYAFVMTAATVPLVTLLLFAAGLCSRLRLRIGEAARLLLGPRARTLARWLPRRLHTLESRRGPTAATELLWALSIGAIYAAWLNPKTPIFGGTKHWMTAYPFLALFAGVGFDDVVRAARSQLLRLRKRLPSLARRATLPALAAVLGTLVLASPLVQTARSHPWGLSSYTPLVGGAAGAATLGLNRTFWGYTTGAVTPYLNTAPRGSAIFIHDTAGPSWDMLLTDGRLRKDLRGAWSIEASSYGLYHHEMHMQGVEYQSWIAYGTLRPDHIAGLDGVPVIWVYRRPTK